MEIGHRIKKRREELGMSQEELAVKVGYKSRSSINKIEVDGRGLPQSKIMAFAKALDTTPAYLMGWESTEEMLYHEHMFEYERGNVLENMGSAFSEFEVNHMKTFSSLTNSNKKKASMYTENLLNMQRMEEEQLHLIPVAAHARTDIEVTDEMRQHDMDIMNDPNF